MRFKSLKGLTLGKPKKQTEQEDDDKFKAIASDRIADMEKRIHGKTRELEEKVQQIQGLSSELDVSELNGDIPKGPHGPLHELTLENGNNLDDVNSLARVVEVEQSDEDEDEEGIKLVEVNAVNITSREKEKEDDEDQSAEASAPSSEVPEKKAKADGVTPPNGAGGTPSPSSGQKEGEARKDQSAEASAALSESPEKEEEARLDDSDDSLNNLFNEEEEEENPLANLIKSLPDVSAREIIDDIKEIEGIIKEWQKK